MDGFLKMHRIVKEKKNNGEFIPPHFHPYFHCIYVLDGKGTVKIENDEINAEKSMFIHINPNLTHAIYGIDSFQSFDIKFYCTGALFEKLSSSPFYTYLNGYEEAIIKDVFDEAIRNDYFTENIINAKMTELILRILRKGMHSSNDLENSFIAPPLNEKNEKISNLNLAIQYIDNNIGKNITVNELSKICGYNPSYFSTIFKNTFGHPPLKYINIKKAEKAKELMITTDYNITQIADILGVELHSFSKMFKKIIGISPIGYYNRANSDIGINISKNSPFVKASDFEIPKEYL